MERSSTQQAHIEAPVQAVWDLLGDPNRHPEWWPKVIEVECAELEQGCRYREVVKGPLGRIEEHELLIETLDGCHEVFISCQATGVYTRFVLTEARGGTFVEGCFGARPRTVGMQIFSALGGRRYLRSWLQQSLGRLKAVAERRASRAASPRSV